MYHTVQIFNLEFALIIILYKTLFFIFSYFCRRRRHRFKGHFGQTQTRLEPMIYPFTTPGCCIVLKLLIIVDEGMQKRTVMNLVESAYKKIPTNTDGFKRKILALQVSSSCTSFSSPFGLSH